MSRKKTIKRRTYETNGPYDVFHIDRNDKLKMFGFTIHGCIDGFSRKLIWLTVSTTNNDPLVLANYYLTAITNLGRAPNTFIVKNFKYFSLKTVTAFCTLHQKEPANRSILFLA